MFGLFKRKTEKEKLQDQYQKLISEAHRLSTTNRKASDMKSYEADLLLKRIELLP